MAKQQYPDRDSFLGPARHGFDITPSASELANNTRGVMVSTDGATITGILEGDSASHTTVPLKNGVMYSFAFKVISSISTGSAKGYY